MKHNTRIFAWIVALALLAGLYTVFRPNIRGGPVDILRSEVSNCRFEYKLQHGFLPKDFRDTLPCLKTRLPQCAASIVKVSDNKYVVTLECPKKRAEYKVDYMLNRDGQIGVFNVHK